MEPTRRERELQRAARLLIYVYDQQSKPIGQHLRRAAADVYCRLDYVPELCGELAAMPVALREAIVYRAHDRTARELADWWEDHEQADRERERVEKQRAEDKALRASAAAKLTAEERRALGLE